MLIDYHLHTLFSYDSNMQPSEALHTAVNAGLSEICFTEHMDYDETPVSGTPVDVPRYMEIMTPYREAGFHGMQVRLGVEIALQNEACSNISREMLTGFPVDFIIGSCHNTDSGDPYTKPYFAGKSRQAAYCEYLENIWRRMQYCDWFHVLGHFDYVAKKAPYSDRELSYEIAPEVFDEIFKTLISRGQGMEYNTSAQPDPNRPLWGLNVWKRYVELGGEFATLGSDAHDVSMIGWRMQEAKELLAAAGVRYFATFENGQPSMHRL